MYSYKTFTEVTDNFPYITKLILKAPQPVRAECVDKDTFSVYVERIDPTTGEVLLEQLEWPGERIYPSKGYRPVSAAYPSDENGRRIYEGDHLTLEFPYEPTVGLGYTVGTGMLPGGYNAFVDCRYRVTQVKEIPGKIPASGWVFDECAGDICPQLIGWQDSVSHYAPLPLQYGYFTPDLEHAKRAFTALDSNYGDEWPHDFPEKLPLVIWLHGMGEGATVPRMSYTGNKVVAVSSDNIQRKLGGAAYVLAPMCPTYWMNSGAENDQDISELTNEKSMYTEALKALIDEFLDLHPDIDRDRVYIGGCSNGGFMTMRMLKSYPDFFAAAYPVCEALRPSDFTEEDIRKLKHLPMWFTQAENDPIVPPDGLVLPLVRRLKAAGAENVHVSLFERIVDQSGRAKLPNGQPMEYMGHFSWIHTFNDDCVYDLDGTRVMHEGRPVTLWRWLGKQRKKHSDQ